ncbi:ribonuclease R [Bacteroidota bacterium]|nr:ribonuclease R [Bacteroidota bacterium]MDC3229882.1 ribonuclease R [Bacteroidota bacterium]
MKKKKNKQLIVNVYTGLWLLFKDNPNKNFAESKLQKLYKKKTKKDPLPVLSSLERLLNENKIIKTSKDRYCLKLGENFSEGIVVKTSKSSVFVSDKSGEIIKIKKENAFFALAGDELSLNQINISKGKKKYVVDSVKHRNKDSFVGEIDYSSGTAFFVSSERKVYFDVLIPRKDFNPSFLNKILVVKVTTWDSKGKCPLGKVIKVLGPNNDFKSHIKSISHKHNIGPLFSNSLLKEISSVKDLSDKKNLNRLDYTRFSTFTIDPDDAKDFDDAISVRVQENKLFEVGVHIADVSHYVQEGSKIDVEASQRGNSVYLVDEVIPMIPEELSNDICSLKEGVPRNCFSVIFKFDSTLKISSFNITKTKIISNKRFTYSEAQSILDNKEGVLFDELSIIKKIAIKLRKKRQSSGAIMFNKKEMGFKLNNQKYPIDIFVKESYFTQKIIEELMLLTNITVANFLKSKNILNAVFRVHDIPDKDKLLSLKNLAFEFNYSIDISNKIAVRKSLNKLLEKVEGTTEQGLFEPLVIRSMAKAEYSSKNIGHYGLSLNDYVHFTSPIRRYADLIIHRIIDSILNNNPNLKSFEGICKHISKKEREASMAERESIKLMQIKYMEKHVGDTFEGVISGVIDHGFFVELVQNGCEGFVRASSLKGFYQIDNKKIALVNNDNKFTLGQSVDVKVIRSDSNKRLLDLELISF